MKFITVIVSRNKSCHVKTLHTVLRFNIMCMHRQGIENEICYINDDPYLKSEMIKSSIKRCDRLFFIEFGVHVDDGSLNQLFEKHEGIGGVVFPSVKEGIDWSMFKQKVLSNSNEPVEQLGLHFDTEVCNKISDDIYTVTKTDPKAWVLMSKNVIKNNKEKKSSDFKVLPRMENMFSKFIENGVKIHAYVASKLVVSYSHECISNILNASGVKVN